MTEPGKKWPKRWVRNDAEKKAQQIKLIHVGQTFLKMDDSTYRCMLAEIGGVTSSKDLTLDGCAKVLAHMRTKGFIPAPKQASAKAAPSRKMDDSAQSKMIRGLWLELHDFGFVRNPAEAALAAYVKRQTGTEALQWLTSKQASDVIESLKEWRMRAQDELKKQFGMTVQDLESAALALYGNTALTAETCTKLQAHFRAQASQK
jgi:phage gp16-like protein